MTAAIEITSILSVLYIVSALVSYLVDRYKTAGATTATATEITTEPPTAITENETVNPTTEQLTSATEPEIAESEANSNELPHDLESLREIARRSYLKGWNLYRDPIKLRAKLLLSS